MIRRFGGHIQGSNVDPRIYSEEELNYWANYMIENYVKTRRASIVTCGGDWDESWLTNWFERNYHKLGFIEIQEEGTRTYKEIKVSQSFYGRPDFLVSRSGTWLRLEIECFSSRYKYMHDLSYAHFILCYEKDEEIPEIEVIELRRILGCDNIINESEWLQYLDVTDETFQKANDAKIMESIAKTWSERTW